MEMNLTGDVLSENVPSQQVRLVLMRSQLAMLAGRPVKHSLVILLLVLD